MTLRIVPTLSGTMLLLCGLLQAQTLPLPERPADAPGGTQFAARIATLPLPQREEEIYAQVLTGNVPPFLRKLCPVQVTNSVSGKTNTARFYVTPDYLAVGSDDDYFLMPVSPNLGQRIADALNCSLPTRKMVNDIYSAAEVKLPPSPIPPSPAMTTVAVFSNHNATVWSQRKAQLPDHPLGALVAGHQKDVVLSARLAGAPGRVAIYGWHQTNGVPIQPLYLKHVAGWVDYSQCIRLVQQSLLVNGEPSTVARVLADPALCELLSDEGVVAAPRYPTNTVVPPASKAAATNSPPPAHVTLTGFTGILDSPLFKERDASFILEPEIKVHMNAPAEPPPSEPGTGVARKTLLVFYALPNGNTTAQTLGKATSNTNEWRYEIQHIGAQTRFLRALLPDRDVLVVYLEAAQRSWPAWRKKHGDKLIPEVIATVKHTISGRPVETVLAGHSGGGSFIFGYLNAVKEIPDDVMRIAFLDSDYAYDRALGHEEKLAHWLRASNQHCLCVLAYNDAVALLNGKSFVSAAGGTWGRSHALEHDLAEDFAFTTRTNADFERFSALDGRIQFILKTNPERKILHTVQVERNGFIHCLLSGTPLEGKGYEYYGERAYSKWIQPE
jgi:hypothetical protein